MTNRQVVQHLLTNEPKDAQARYYALHHPDNRTTVMTAPADSLRPTSYICLSRTGYDLFSPLVTMRLPDDLNVGYGLLKEAIQPGQSVIFSTPPAYTPLIGALFDVESEQEMKTLVMDSGRYEPTINIYVVKSAGANGLPRAVIRKDGRLAAGAGINWQTDKFAEINVEVDGIQRRQGYGKSVVAALCSWIMDGGRKPIYVVAADNAASISLAEEVGFVDLGIRTHFMRATMRG